MPPGSAVLTVELKVNLLAPADGELVRARGQVVKAGRTLTVCRIEAEVRKQGAWRACATGLQTLMRLPPTDGRPEG